MGTGAESLAFAPSLAETHSAVVWFFGDRAYKLKKPVDLGFLDFRTREAREAACRREVALNSRLAPDVYLGVADVLGPEGEPCDHLVVMRRMPDDRRLSALVLAGVDVTAEISAVATLIARFHAEAARSPEADRAASPSSLAARWATNTMSLRSFAGRYVDGDHVEAIDGLAARYLAGRRPLFDARIEAGRACDGHGDLLADDIFCLDDGPRVLDCLEFDDALRLEDVLADVAFLAMDLERLGRPDLGALFLDTYRTCSGDAWPSSLAHHHIAYRAQVRAKVSAIRADQGVTGSAEKANDLLRIVHRHLQQARVRLVLVGGLPGTGKSTLAAGLGVPLDAAVLRSDVVRKELAGLAPTVPAPAGFREGLYTEQATAATYGELLHRTEHALRMGSSVVVDASWSNERWRNAARSLADVTSSDLVELCCATTPEVAAHRLRRRTAVGGDPSDADEVVAAEMATVADPWPRATVIDTTRAPDDVLQSVVLALIPTEVFRGPDATFSTSNTPGRDSETR
jgi:uncharacterized protein